MKKLTKKDFDMIKVLQSAGLNVNRSSKAIKRSGFSVTWVYKSDSLEDYFKNVRAYREKLSPKISDVSKTASEVNGGLVRGTSELEELKQIKAALLRIDTTLRLATDGNRKLRWS